MAIVASGQLTIVDLNDTKQLIMYIGASQSKIIVSTDNDLYIPDYSEHNQTLTPQLFVGGTSEDIANKSKSIKWFYKLNGIGNPVEITGNEPEYEIGSSLPHPLTIRSNILLNNNSVTYICEIEYQEDSNSLLTKTKSEIEIVKISNGEKGSDAIYANVWTPDGNTMQNGLGNVKCQIDIYKGMEKVVGDIYKWYMQDTSATSSSGGDVDGGNGWRLLTDQFNAGTSGYNTPVLNVPASAVIGTESFKAISTYENVNYGGVTTIVDLSDPLFIRIDGANVFRNGEGDISVRATIIRAGDEIDQLGTSYTYQWFIYDVNNIKTSFSKTGKNITVSANDIKGTGNLVCEISK